jgi:hypothetical protein
METLSPHSRAWIYISTRKFSEAEVVSLQDLIQKFCKDWTAHGSQLKAVGEVRYHQIIILMVDETQAGASGCSIDKSVHFIESLEREFSVQLFNRMLIPVLMEEELKVETPEGIADLFSTKKINESTAVFNTTITTKNELDKREFIPLSESWVFGRIHQAV